MTMHGKVCLVTGATNGIGKESAKTLAALGAKVIIAGRSAQRAEETAAEIKAQTGEEVGILLADFASTEQTRQLAADFHARYDRLDVLLNNAGAFFLNRQTTIDNFEMTIAVNHLNGYFLFTHLLLDTLKHTAAEQGEARIVTVSSDAHYSGHIHLDDLHLSQGYSGMKAYSQSKLANVLFTYELARQLDGTGVSAACLHPGFVATGFASNNGWFARLLMPLTHLFAISPQKGAETMLFLATAPELNGVTGQYYEKKQAKRSSDELYDQDVARRLWEISAEMVGI